MSDLADPATKDDAEIDFDLFEQLSILYDEDDLSALNKLANWYIRNKDATADELHLAYSFKALAQVTRKQFSRAMKNADKAFAADADCPWVRLVRLRALEAFALSHNDNKSIEAGIELGERILSDGMPFMAQNGCSKGIPKAAKLSMLNDARFLLAFLYLGRANINGAKKLLTEFLSDFDEERSWFTRQEAAEELARLE